MTNGERDPAGPFSARLQERLAELHWSARELARRGLNQQTVLNMLNGRRPRVENVLKLAKAFDDPVNPWLKLAGYPEQAEEVEENELLGRIRRGVEMLDASERRVLARMVEGILVTRGYIAGPQAKGDLPHPAVGAVGEPMGGGPRAGAPDIVDDTTLRDPLKESDEV
jgi:transcriptional regulator with XRE-family HTH domain